jgi:hypothetical protein
MIDCGLETASLGKVFPRAFEMLEFLYIKNARLHKDELVELP